MMPTEPQEIRRFFEQFYLRIWKEEGSDKIRPGKMSQPLDKVQHERVFFALVATGDLTKACDMLNHSGFEGWDSTTLALRMLRYEEKKAVVTLTAVAEALVYDWRKIGVPKDAIEQIFEAARVRSNKVMEDEFDRQLVDVIKKADKRLDNLSTKGKVPSNPGSSS